MPTLTTCWRGVYYKIDTHLPRSPCRLDLAIVPGNHQRRAWIALPAKLIHKGNEVIGRDLEFGIGTMAREYEEDTGRKRETMTMKEDSRDKKGKKTERERKKRRWGDRREEREGGEMVRGCSGARKCPRPRGEKRVRVSLNNFDHTSRQSDTRAYEYIHLNAPRCPGKYCPNF